MVPWVGAGWEYSWKLGINCWNIHCGFDDEGHCSFKDLKIQAIHSILRFANMSWVLHSNILIGPGHHRHWTLNHKKLLIKQCTVQSAAHQSLLPATEGLDPGFQILFYVWGLEPRIYGFVFDFKWHLLDYPLPPTPISLLLDSKPLKPKLSPPLSCKQTARHEHGRLYGLEAYKLR